jgi:voltage-gated potassium channel
MVVEIGLIGVGTIFYHVVEGWGWLDSVYFCVVTLATVGYGDLHPDTPLAKLFTIPYIIFGVAMLGVFIQLAGKAALESLQESTEKRQQRLEARRAKTEEP